MEAAFLLSSHQLGLVQEPLYHDAPDYLPMAPSPTSPSPASPTSPTSPASLSLLGSRLATKRVEGMRERARTRSLPSIIEADQSLSPLEEGRADEELGVVIAPAVQEEEEVTPPSAQGDKTVDFAGAGVAARMPRVYEELWASIDARREAEKRTEVIVQSGPVQADEADRAQRDATVAAKLHRRENMVVVEDGATAPLAASSSLRRRLSYRLSWFAGLN